MTIIYFTLFIFIISFFAGLVGAITGLGGGIVLIPALVLLFHVDIHYAMGASLISVMATSSGAAIYYLKCGYTNIRIGMFLETGAVIGAMAGAILVSMLSTSFIAILFGAVLFISAYLTSRRKEDIELYKTSHPWAIYLKLDSQYHGDMRENKYRVQHAPWALLIMTISGALSGLLGIGSGALKVLAMDQVMKIPYKVSAATSNFIIGITAAVSAGVYLANGYINPPVIFPVLIGVMLGATGGAFILEKAHSRYLRMFFSLAIFIIGMEILYKGLTGKL